MAPRRSTRLTSSQQGSSPSASQTSSPATNKRKAESGASPSAKRGKKNVKEQLTIEEAMDVDKNEDEQPKIADDQTDAKGDAAGKSQDQETDGTGKTNGDTHKLENKTETARPEQKNETPQSEPKVEKKDESNGSKSNDSEIKNEPTEKDTDQQESAQKHPPKSIDNSNGKNGRTSIQSNGEEASKSADAGTEAKSAAPNGDAVEPHARDDKVPSSILEKGIMYLMYRGRVNIDSPNSVEDLARSFLILRPLPHGAKLSDGPVGDEKNCRLIAIPKKTLPVSGKDKWTAFVETSNTSFADLKDNWMKSDTYQTQAGERETPAAAPAAEAVYAITTTGRESHLAYITTLPEDLGKLQNDLGLRAKGSFVLSTKNPKAPGPANANLGKDPGFSQEIQDQFRSLRWAPTKPEHLNYESAQFLMIGEGEQGLEKATEQQEGDEDKIAPKEELEKLEGEDEIRVEHLNGEDAVFADLGTNAQDYPKLQTTW